MKQKHPPLSRRQLLASLGLAAFIPPLMAQHQGKGPNDGTSSGNDAAITLVDPNSPSAVALGYAANHQRVDTKRWLKKAEDVDSKQRCSTCALFRNGDGNSGSCSIFGSKRVAANGWCNAWTQR